jgi:hypothetical protein
MTSLLDCIQCVGTTSVDSVIDLMDEGGSDCFVTEVQTDSELPWI